MKMADIWDYWGYKDEFKETKNPFKSGDVVVLKTDGRKYTVYGVYDDEYVSLGLFDYPDVEQDYLTHISEIEGAIK
jgi:hypothetical protein